MKSRLILHTGRESARVHPLQGAITFNLAPTAAAPLGTAAGDISTYSVEYALERPTTPLPQGRSGWSGTVGIDIWCETVPDVNTAHFEALFRDWGKICDQKSSCKGDRNADGKVDFADYSLFLADWDPAPPGLRLPTPVAHWKFEETSGTTVYDFAGQNDGVVFGGSWVGGTFGGTWVPGKFGNALQFDGVDDYVNFGKSPVLAPWPTMTISLWVNHKVVPGKGHYLDCDGPKMSDISYGVAPDYTGKLYGVIGDGKKMVTVYSPHVVVAGEWMPITFSRDEKELVLHVNGTDRTAKSYTITPYRGSVTCTMGGDGSYCFAGIIDDVRIFDAVLTEEQIAALVSGTAQ